MCIPDKFIYFLNYLVKFKIEVYKVSTNSRISEINERELFCSRGSNTVTVTSILKNKSLNFKIPGELITFPVIMERGNIQDFLYIFCGLSAERHMSIMT